MIMVLTIIHIKNSHIPRQLKSSKCAIIYVWQVGAIPFNQRITSKSYKLISKRLVKIKIN